MGLVAAGLPMLYPANSANDNGGVARIEVYCGKTARWNSVKGKRISYGRRDYIQIPRTWIFKEWSPKKQHLHSIKAIATVEPKCSIPTENSPKCDSNFQFNSNLESEGFQLSDDTCPEMDEKEQLRRTKISDANKGNVPWNKGKRHSPETIQRIRERTRIAMQNPKVKMKLVKMKLLNLGHAQSEKTRIKIGIGVRQGWQRRREMLTVQESCLLEWKDMIAEASRKGYSSEDELLWDSYKVLDEQLRQEWVQSIEKRKTMPRPKGSKRAPKSPEQRRKISEAISAKWADPEYRGRVCSALSKYYGVPVGGDKSPRRKPTRDTSSAEREPVKRSMQPERIMEEAESIKTVISRRRRNATPSYKDPMASCKLEMIKKIRAGRLAMETRKREAIERAKLLIAEAEKAAKALEVAALKSPLARASLLETRKLIAEAIRSIESIENGHLISQDDGGEASRTSNGSVSPVQTNIGLPEQRVNGSKHLFPSDESGYEAFDYDRLTLQNALDSEDEESIGKDISIGQSSIVNVSVKYKREEEGSPTSKEDSERSMPSTSKSKKWFCGRLIEVEGD